jgi:hypothetical protein
MFKDRTLVIATKHAKERAIAPILERELGVRCISSEGLDTDLLGTFTARSSASWIPWPQPGKSAIVPWIRPAAIWPWPARDPSGPTR